MLKYVKRLFGNRFSSIEETQWWELGRKTEFQLECLMGVVLINQFQVINEPVSTDHSIKYSTEAHTAYFFSIIRIS